MKPPIRPLAALLVAAASVVTPATTGAADPSATPCRAVVERGVLPAWARGGFSEARPRMAHSIGRSGAIAALIFGEPLQAPTSPERSNKILWVSHKDPLPQADLRIRAQRMRPHRSRRRWPASKRSRRAAASASDALHVWGLTPNVQRVTQAVATNRWLI